MSINQSDSLEITNVLKDGNPLDRIALILSIWFGVGLLPGVPGTFGTAGAIPLYVLADSLGPNYQVVLLLITISGAIWSSGRAQRLLCKIDSRQIVIDEVAGFSLTVVFLPFTWLTLGAGFILFRLFDILKPPPMKTIERKAKGGFGVVLDDLVAGFYAHLALRLLLHIPN